MNASFRRCELFMMRKRATVFDGSMLTAVVKAKVIRIWRYHGIVAGDGVGLALDLVRGVSLLCDNRTHRLILRRLP